LKELTIREKLESGQNINIFQLFYELTKGNQSGNKFKMLNVCFLLKIINVPNLLKKYFSFNLSSISRLISENLDRGRSNLGKAIFHIW